jgi:hypothetical protein
VSRFGRAIRRSPLSLLALGAVATSCRQPTEIVVRVQTDLKCGDLPKTSIAATVPSELATSKLTASTVRCEPTDKSALPSGSELGEVVLLPTGSHQAKVGVQVVTAFGRHDSAPTTEYCQAAESDLALDFSYCVIARRLLRFAPHERVAADILMEVSCAGVRCDTTQTCAAGDCVRLDTVAPDGHVTGQAGASGAAGTGGLAGGAGSTALSGGALAITVPPGTASSAAACNVGYQLASTALPQVPSLAITSTDIVVGYEATLDGGTRWVFDHRDLATGARSSPAMVIDPPPNTTGLGPLTVTATSYVTLAGHTAGLALYVIDSATGTWEQVLFDSPALTPPTDGLFDLGDRYAFSAISQDGLLYWVETPKDLKLAPSVTQLQASAASGDVVTSWDGATMATSFHEGSPSVVMLSTSQSPFTSWSPAGVTDGTIDCQHSDHATNGSQYLVAWEAPDVAATLRVYTQLVDPLTGPISTPLMVDAGSMPQVAWLGSAWSVQWARPTAAGAELVRQLLDSSGVPSGTSKIVVVTGATEPVQTAPLIDGRQALLWRDSANGSLQFAICN